MIPRDKLLHLACGAAAAAAAVGLLWLGQRHGWPLAIAIAGPVFGVALELYQKVRNEGQAEWLDAAATAAPFEVAAAALHLAPQILPQLLKGA